jgi:hypothetical protein
VKIQVKRLGNTVQSKYITAPGHARSLLHSPFGVVVAAHAIFSFAKAAPYHWQWLDEYHLWVDTIYDLKTNGSLHLRFQDFDDPYPLKVLTLEVVD